VKIILLKDQRIWINLLEEVKWDTPVRYVLNLVMVPKVMLEIMWKASIFLTRLYIIAIFVERFAIHVKHYNNIDLRSVLKNKNYFNLK